MTDAQIIMLGMGIFYAIVFIGLIVLEVHLIRILISLRPENCEKCTGFFKEKKTEIYWKNFVQYEKSDYIYTYKVNGVEYELHGGGLKEVKEKEYPEYSDDEYSISLTRKKEAEEREKELKEKLPETIEVLYSKNFPKRGYTHDVDSYNNPWYDKIFIGIVAFGIVVCLAFATYSFISIL